MLVCPPATLHWGDVIGFTKNGEFLAGKVCRIGKQHYPTNLYRQWEWHIEIEMANGEKVTGSFDPRDRIMLFAMADKDNPAMSRNHRHNWASFGIEETSQAAIGA